MKKLLEAQLVAAGMKVDWALTGEAKAADNLDLEYVSSRSAASNHLTVIMRVCARFKVAFDWQPHINTGLLHAFIVFLDGDRIQKLFSLWTLLPAHLQHYKQLILTPEQRGGRKRGKDSSEHHMIRQHKIRENSPSAVQFTHIIIMVAEHVSKWQKTERSKGGLVMLDTLLAAHCKSELEIHAWNTKWVASRIIRHANIHWSQVNS